LAFWTPSIESVRMVSMARRSRVGPAMVMRDRAPERAGRGVARVVAKV
jgi:hypothetical protein